MQATYPNPRPILLIEDEPAISELLVEYLTEEGYAVTTVADSAVALVALATRPFALIVTDALTEGYPPDKRWTQLEAIRRAAQGTPIIICTAHRADYFADYTARGFSALMIKPFDLDALLALIVHTLEGVAP